MKEEDKLLKKVGKENPFTTPQGYFENLTSDIMNKLPEKEETKETEKVITMWDRIKPWAYMAAMFAGAALIIQIGSFKPNPFADKQVATTDDIEMAADEYLDMAIDKALLDDYSLYVYLSDASMD
ncbi:hypothetical protein D0T50_10015 [Bacteroides sp. 214]|uniref:hypothetical protein n=1 Tax=Bacteroides sp. 214 TaxID=2302935 RepID=UPI0013D23B16|nr:hypothetical protein [Bacteroides sp. 214]NDW13229.1 hypothetical protein [Bacteroides sp. 214]